jgi:hypothetical protein
MIIKGGSRSGPEQLARHLQRRDTNEQVNILELQSPASSLVEAFRDWQTLVEGTHGSKGLYHANIDPAQNYTMTPEQWQRAVAVLEKELKLEGQPRAVVMHEKHGREHIHVVWARTDIDEMILRSDSQNYQAHERASQMLELEFGHEHVPGKHAKRDREKQPEFPRAEANHAEWQQGERTGLHPAEQKDQITSLKQSADNAQAFKAALEEQGYVLARGDRRDFVIVDQAGQVHSLGRQIRGVKPSSLREFMKGIDPQTLPTAEQAAGLQKQKQDERKQATPGKDESPAPEPAQPVEQTKGLSQDEIQALQDAVAERQARETGDMRRRHDAELQRTRDILDLDIAEKIGHLDARQEAERARFGRANASPEGLDRVIDAIQRWWNPKLAQARDAKRESRLQEMEDRQKKERDEYEETLKKTRDLDLDNLAERHAQQLRDHAARAEEDLDRYIREQETARRLRAEIEERERKRDEERTRDGPEWPPPRSL